MSSKSSDSGWSPDSVFSSVHGMFRTGFWRAMASFSHSPGTVEVMQRNLTITNGCILARERALRLVKRVAKAIDDMKTFPTNEEVIQLCSENTLQDCKHDILIDVASFFSWWFPLAALADVCWP